MSPLLDLLRPKNSPIEHSRAILEVRVRTRLQSAPYHLRSLYIVGCCRMTAYVGLFVVNPLVIVLDCKFTYFSSIINVLDISIQTLSPFVFLNQSQSAGIQWHADHLWPFSCGLLWHVLYCTVYDAIVSHRQQVRNSASGKALKNKNIPLCLQRYSFFFRWIEE